MFTRICEEQFGISPPASDGKTWDIFNYPGIVERRNEIWTYMLSTPGLIYGLDKYSYTDELLAKLRERGEVICVTSIVVNTVGYGTSNEVTIPGYYADERIRWLIDKAGFSREDIILAYKKHTVEGNALIDDKPSNVVKWANRWDKKNQVPVLWQPPEKSISIDDDRVFHCGDVNELIKFLDERFL
jgi:5'(3')-deoxyribonucleotidase